MALRKETPVLPEVQEELPPEQVLTHTQELRPEPVPVQAPVQAPVQQQQEKRLQLQAKQKL
jgi:hypothetical protein